VPVIWDLDTRALVRHLRTVGALRGVVSTDGTPPEKLVTEARAIPTMAGLDLATRVTCAKKYDWSTGSIDLAAPVNPARASASAGSADSKLSGHGTGPGSLGGRSFSSDITAAGKKGPLAPEGRPRHKVIAYDFGIKQNILRLLVDHGCEVVVVPAQTSAEDVLALKPSGVFLSNGPGDPEPVGYAIENIRKLLGRVPIFGICLGHQLCGLALGGRTFKLKFGHHGSNHPVKNLLTEKVEITAQNHGFCVDPDSLPSSDVEVTHLNLNDHTNEGLRHRSLPLFSVQYHPEASPGPHDARYLFNEFIKMMDKGAR
jgi:carbamoyl-phosphate synthase small subunit